MISVWLVVAAGLSVLMAVLWLVQLRTRNAALVDAGWAGGLGLAALAAAAFGSGDPTRRALVALVGGAWGLRLAAHLLADRIVGKPEEGRYVSLRAAWGGRAALGFFLFYQAQAILAALLAAPFLVASHDPTHGPSPRDLLAVALWIVAMIGESAADRQLAAFKADPSTKGTVCRRGLWAWSRHPNYFFEWLVWCAFALLATGGPFGAAAWGAPAVMLFFILRVTGIPPTEAQALRSRGDDYRRYQSEVSAFVPLPPRIRS